MERTLFWKVQKSFPERYGHIDIHKFPGTFHYSPGFRIDYHMMLMDGCGPILMVESFDITESGCWRVYWLFSFWLRVKENFGIFFTKKSGVGACYLEVSMHDGCEKTKSMDVKTLKTSVHECFIMFYRCCGAMWGVSLSYNLWVTRSRSTTCTEVCWIDWDDLLSLKIGIQNDDVPK